MSEFTRCEQCGKRYDAVKEGKLRMNMNFCSITCADSMFPAFKLSREQLAEAIEQYKKNNGV